MAGPVGPDPGALHVAGGVDDGVGAAEVPAPQVLEQPLEPVVGQVEGARVDVGREVADELGVRWRAGAEARSEQAARQHVGGGEVFRQPERALVADRDDGGAELDRGGALARSGQEHGAGGDASAAALVAVRARTAAALTGPAFGPCGSATDTGHTGFVRTNAGGRILVDPRGGSFCFDAGALCLDFAHTGGEGPYAVFESLHGPADLAAWLAQPPLGAALTVRATRRDLAAAKALRQAIWVAAHTRVAGEPPPADVVAVINRAAAAAPLVPVLSNDATAAGWAAPVRAAQVLSTLAREMVELLAGPLADRIRECAGDNCPLVFVDSSRPGLRRWCAMERCGNRHKLRALRARRTPDR